jgi:hypothetical protein
MAHATTIVRLADGKVVERINKAAGQLAEVVGAH